MKLLSRPDGFMLFGKLAIDFLSTSELLYPNMKIRLRLIRARPNFTHPLENVTELIVLGERMSSVAVDKFGVFRKNV